MSADSAVRRDEVDLSLRQFVGAWRLICAAGPQVDLGTHDGIDYTFSGLGIAFFNMAFPAQRDLDAGALAASAAGAMARVSARNVPWFFVVTHERLAPGVDAGAVLDAAGFAAALPLTGMIADTVTPAHRPAPAGLDLVVARDDAACEALVDVNAAAYGMSLDGCKAVLARHAFWQPHVPVIGLVNGTPATSAAVLRVDGHRYVAWVATLPSHQRRGLAEAAMRHALGLAGEDTPTVLHATEAGLPVYERMGYGTISTHSLFIEKRFMEGH